MVKDKILHTKALVVKSGIKADEGTVDVVGSSNVIDRLGDTIKQAGWKLANFKKNPVILWGHNIKEERPPIGKALRVWIEDKGKKTAKLMFRVKFDLQDTFAAEIFRKIKDGFINTVSVGFKPIDWEEKDPNEMFSPRIYTKQELLELSWVPVPANPEALVALKGMKDKRFTPVKLEDIYTKKIDVTKPFPNEHACRLKSPGFFKKGSFRSMSRTHNGKKYRVILGRLKGKTKLTEQSYRYKKSIWDKGSARIHCKNHNGTFEAATETSLKEKGFKEPTTEVSVEVKSKKLSKEEKEKIAREAAEKAQKDLDKKLEEKKADEKEKVKKKELKEKEKKEVKEKVKAVEPEPISKKVIGYKDHGIAPESESWDGPGEVAKAETSDLKKMCTWYDSEKSDVKSSYKLPHHKADGYKCVWRGVAAAMAALLGARGGVKIPTGDKRGVYNHLKKHYKQFDKEAPDFKMVKDQVLRGFDEEIHALTLDREDRYVVRLIKRVLDGQKKAKKVKTRYTPGQVKAALQVLDIALSQLLTSSKKGGEKWG